MILVGPDLPHAIYSEESLILQVLRGSSQLAPIKIPAGGKLRELYAIIQPDNLVRERKYLNDLNDVRIKEAGEARKNEEEMQKRIDAEFK